MTVTDERRGRRGSRQVGASPRSDEFGRWPVTKASLQHMTDELHRMRERCEPKGKPEPRARHRPNRPRRPTGPPGDRHRRHPSGPARRIVFTGEIGCDQREVRHDVCAGLRPIGVPLPSLATASRTARSAPTRLPVVVVQPREDRQLARNTVTPLGW
jgi:hypothetical protein